VSKRIVDRLEAVEIKQDQCEFLALGGRNGIEFRNEASPVDETCQGIRIGTRLHASLLGQRSLLGFDCALLFRLNGKPRADEPFERDILHLDEAKPHQHHDNESKTNRDVCSLRSSSEQGRER
jgi:hypothetical protein